MTARSAPPSSAREGRRGGHGRVRVPPGLAAIWEFVAVVNRYVDASAPWELKKDPAKQPR